ncbi:aromatic-ring-hydroxylating dioxygenase subunit beta [Pusillimonas noertemannii]|uniref:Benzoate/toluate 1,2-dioxygenase beta subunit/2,4,5-trichlorophenoxyacetic acid oxygenase 2 n=1 Tax=Pusillimonas noertemannii TaxID=305977 RepID=A0A2U1CL02_9BURK|nr:aromatic-ring-hydroxylating dioxygenase subunit beta [Pusillimonas noertemannii]NYT69203.1 nuclear transport factor 2 family protein [Pusillimonas noertemannii]PVY61672.1 benzoate/toluate 1,2-dioxygenase beta subunit/2,4,5-trichlorophenoxyacetic acid oxygenase 2 [Pusillimonas noertemannii]
MSEYEALAQVTELLALETNWGDNRKRHLSMNKYEVLAQVTEFLALEANLVDNRKWDEWLALYEPDAVFWVPAWTSEDQVTQDPHNETSLIYIEGRDALSDRAWRVGTGRSLASTPLIRTAHLVGAPVVEPVNAERLRVQASWSCHSYSLRTQAEHTYFGLYDYQLKIAGETLSVVSKRATLLNDRVPSLLDFYCV